MTSSRNATNIRSPTSGLMIAPPVKLPKAGITKVFPLNRKQGSLSEVLFPSGILTTGCQ